MGKYGMTSNYMIINYLNCLQKAATLLTVSSGRQRQAAVNFDVSPYQANILPSDEPACVNYMRSWQVFSTI